MELDLDVSFESANSARFADIHHNKPKGWRANRKLGGTVVIHNYGAGGAGYQASW